MLTGILLIPALGALVVALLPRRSASFAKWVALGATAAALALSGVVVAGYEFGGGLQFVERYDWIAQLNIEYFLGIDGLSLPILVLSTLLSLLAVVGSWKVTSRPRFYYAMLLLLAAGMNGVFMALDFVLFYVFWEIVLVPMYFIISQWGGERREYAAIKFFLYTFLGSVFMLVGIIALYLQTGTFDMVALQATTLGAALPVGFQMWVFLAFFLGFAVKVPMWPLHTWLPDAHVEAPTAASVLLAGVMLKMGTYGFLRVSVGVLPDAFHAWQLPLAVLAVIAIIYGAVVAFAQTDMKKLVAYSSVSHMGFAMLGIASGTAVGLNAAMAVNVAHGLATGMLFFLVGMVYDRAHTRQIADLSGIANRMPIYTGLFAFAAFASMGVPPLAGFVGEFLAIVGTWTSAAIPHALVVVGALGVLLGAAYMLWLLQRSLFGPVSEAVEPLTDIGVREIATVLPLAALIVAIGVSWSLLLNYTDPFATALAAAIGG